MRPGPVRTWARIDVDIYRDPRVRDMSVEAKFLWTLVILHSRKYLTDGLISAADIHALVNENLPLPDTRVTRARHSMAKRVSAELLAAGLLETSDDGYRIRSYADWQESRQQVEQRRKAARVRASRYRDGRRASRPAGSLFRPLE